MKRDYLAFAIVTTLAGVASPSISAMAQTLPKVEFIDIRWDGVDRMCVVFPDGRVDFVGKDLQAIPRPEDANKRAFYMTQEMNRMAAQGYEFVSMISDEIVMKRTLPR